MAFIKFVLAASMLALVAADVSEIVGQNQYLPPSKGYNYDRPSIPFPSSPASRPTPSYQSPSPSRPTGTYQSTGSSGTYQSTGSSGTYQSTGSSGTYQPSGTSGTFQSTGTYQSPTPSYQSPSPNYGSPLTPTRPSAPRPIPGYSQPGYQPGTAPSGTQGTIIGASSSGGEHDHHHDHHHEPGMPYDFEYKVKDDYYGTDYSRNEVSDGDIIRGEYRVQLPDGRLQIVKYTADWKNGFNADVSYQGEPNFPTGSGSSQYPSGQSPNSYIPPASNSY